MNKLENKIFANKKGEHCCSPFLRVGMDNEVEQLLRSIEQIVNVI